MKKISYWRAFVAICGFGLLTACSSPEVGPRNFNLVPAPTQTTVTKSNFALKPNSVISYSDPSLKGIANDLAAYAKRQAGLTLTVAEAAGQNPGNGIFLSLNPSNQALAALPAAYGISAKDGNPADERYALDIQENNITIEAMAAEGVYRGTTSLKQLIAGNPAASGETLYLPVLNVVDNPRFAWRGFSFDLSRCFFTVDEVKQVIDLLSLYKFNVLHMHLTDNEGWRIEIKSHPKLTEIGGMRENEGKPVGFFTQEQYKEIVAYAQERFITIVPEIDLPGHTKAIFAAYPDLKNAAKLNFQLNMSGQAIGALDVDDPKATQLVKDVIAELAAMTPGSYIHIGGDETWGLSEDKYVRFVDQTRRIVKEQGKKVVGWQESARTNLDEGDLMQYWVHYKNTPSADNANDTTKKKKSTMPKELQEMMKEAFMKNAKDMGLGLEKKARIILSPSGYVYLDHPYKEASVDSTQAAEQGRLGLAGYTKQTIAEMYDWNPAKFDDRLDPAKDIAGVEAAIWCETVRSFSDLQFLLMPRLAGVAEKGWSAVENTNWDEYKVRLASHSLIWDAMNWNYFKSSLVDWK